MDNQNKNSSNPSVPSGSNIILEVPKNIKVKLVDASNLSAFKLWNTIASILSNVSVGFWVWFGQNTVTQIAPYLKYTSIIITLLCIISYYICYLQNKKMKDESREINYTPQ